MASRSSNHRSSNFERFLRVPQAEDQDKDFGDSLKRLIVPSAASLRCYAELRQGLMLCSSAAGSQWVGVGGVTRRSLLNRNRSFSVSAASFMSASTGPSGGEPQGSVLGPVLFCISLLPLDFVVSEFKGFWFHCDAVDLQLSPVLQTLGTRQANLSHCSTVWLLVKMELTETSSYS